ncbi:MAG: D-glycerate dehydrogenase [Chloroflexi bacterium]|nr:D-glycerate dehydrogenase [Chloroflexota bacterium]
MVANRVFVTREVAREAIELLRREFEVDVWPDEGPPPYPVLVERARGCVGLLTNVTDRVDAALMDATPGLKVIANNGVGYDNIDVAAASQRGIAVGNTPGILTRTTADLAFALILASARRIAELDREVRAGRWRLWHPLAYLGSDVHGKTLGVVGLGQIGMEVARRALGFDMRVLYSDTSAREDAERRYGLEQAPDLPALLRGSDFVSLHVPLTPQTRHLIGAAELAMMKPAAFLVNTSRGPVVDQRALYHALRDRVIAGAALDVMDPEPIPPDDPLLALPNVTITPHVGSGTYETRMKMATMAAENIIAAVMGKPMPACVNAGAIGRR